MVLYNNSYSLISFYDDFFLFLFLILFYAFVGIFIIRDNLIFVLICLEMIFLVIISMFLIFGFFFDDFFGQICSLILLTLAAVESSISLAFLVMYYRISGHTALNFVGLLKG